MFLAIIRQQQQRRRMIYAGIGRRSRGHARPTGPRWAALYRGVQRRGRVPHAVHRRLALGVGRARRGASGDCVIVVHCLWHGYENAVVNNIPCYFPLLLIRCADVTTKGWQITSAFHLRLHSHSLPGNLSDSLSMCRLSETRLFRMSNSMMSLKMETEPS